MWTKLYRWYLQHLFSRYADYRGMTRIARFLRLKSADEFKEGGEYVYSLREIDIRMPNRHTFRSLPGEEILEGYTMKQGLSEGDVVVDAGSSPGEFAIYAAKKGATVISLDPDPEAADEVRWTVEYNDVKDAVTVLEKGLWSEETEMEFEAGGGGASHVSNSGNHTITTTTLDMISAEYGPLDFVKMDIEGAEVEALKGAEDCISEEAPFFAIASYHDFEDGMTSEWIEQFLSERGYTVETGHPRHQTTWAWKQ